MRKVRTWWSVPLLLVALAAPIASGRPLAAQQPDSIVVVPAVPTATERGVELSGFGNPTSPGGAFLRALVLPGWGHAAIGAYSRGGFYFATESTTGFLLARTMRRLAQAKDARDLREDRLREVLLAQGVVSDSVPARLDEDPDVRRSRRLVDSRRQQLEDWIALGTFLVFLSGADAFVSAHLRDFPDPLSVQADLADPATGAVAELGLRVRVGPPFAGR